MSDAISNTSPLLYLHRGGALEWLPRLFGEVWVPAAVASELEEGAHRGYPVPDLKRHEWIRIVDPKIVPSEWLTIDLGPGELAAMALTLENPDRVVLLDDALARRIAEAATLEVWGTLRVLLEAKSRGLTRSIKPVIDQLCAAGMWISSDVRRRVMTLAGEGDDSHGKRMP